MTFRLPTAAESAAQAAREAARLAAMSPAQRAADTRDKAFRQAQIAAAGEKEQKAFDKEFARRGYGTPAPRGDWAQPATGAELAAINARIAAAQLRGSQQPRNSAGQFVGAGQQGGSGVSPPRTAGWGLGPDTFTPEQTTAARNLGVPVGQLFPQGTYTPGTPWSTIPFVGNPVRTPYQTAPRYTPPATSNPNNYRPPNNVAGYTGPGYTPAQQQAPIYNPAGPPGADNPAQYRDPLYDSNGNWITGKPTPSTPPAGYDWRSSLPSGWDVPKPRPTQAQEEAAIAANVREFNASAFHRAVGMGQRPTPSTPAPTSNPTTFPQGDWRNDPNLRIDTKQNTPAQNTGQPPNIQTRDIVNLPGGGQGSSTMANWLNNNPAPSTGQPPAQSNPNINYGFIQGGGPYKRPDWLSKDHGFDERTGGIVYGFPQHPLGDKRPTPTNTNNYNNYNQPIDPKPPRWTPQAPLYIPGGPPAQNTPAPSQPGQTYDSNYWNAKYNPQGPPPAPPTWGTPNTPRPYNPLDQYRTPDFYIHPGNRANPNNQPATPAPTNNGSTRPIYNDPNTPRPYNPLDKYPGGGAPAPINKFPPLGRPEQNTTNTPGMFDAYNARNGINSQPPATINTPAPTPNSGTQPITPAPTPNSGTQPITPAPGTPPYVTPVPGSAFGTNFTGGIPEIGAAADRERQESARRNAERSNSILSGYERQIGDSRRMSDADYQQSQNDYAGITGDAMATRDRNMARIDQYGQAARSDLDIKNKQALAAASQNAIKRGLGNTTIQDSLKRGQNFDNSRQMMNLEDQLLQNRISTDSNLSNSYQNTLQTRAQFLQNQRAQKMANERDLRGRQLQFIEGINDEGPSFNDVSNYYMQAAALRG